MRLCRGDQHVASEAPPRGRRRRGRDDEATGLNGSGTLPREAVVASRQPPARANAISLIEVSGCARSSRRMFGSEDRDRPPSPRSTRRWRAAPRRASRARRRSPRAELSEVISDRPDARAPPARGPRGSRSIVSLASGRELRRNGGRPPREPRRPARHVLRDPRGATRGGARASDGRSITLAQFGPGRSSAARDARRGAALATVESIEETEASRSSDPTCGGCCARTRRSR